MELEEVTIKENEELLARERAKHYSFLIQRTSLRYNYKKILKRRSWITDHKSKMSYPELPDNVLEWLYSQAKMKYGRQIGYQMTDAEVIFLKTLKHVISKNPKRYTNVKIMPFEGTTKLDLEFQKILMGLRIPDFAVFGLRNKTSSIGVIFEINGDSHKYKGDKDISLINLAKSIGFLVIPIENEKAGDISNLERILNDLTPCNSKNLKLQTAQLVKRLWALTVSCHFTLKEIDEMVIKNFGIHLNLENELAHLLTSLDCPRTVKSEARICGYSPEIYFAANSTRKVLV